MKAIVLDENRNLDLAELDVSECSVDNVGVKIKVAGICGTDLSYWKYGSSRLKLPVVLGHEASGIIEKVGANVTGLKIGDPVIMTTTYHTCGTCKYCREGSINLCLNREGVGSKRNGYLSEYAEVPGSSCIPLPVGMDFEEGAMVELLSCSVHALFDKITITPNDLVVVFGPGPLGILSAQVAQLFGARVILCGLTSDRERFEVAKQCNVMEHLDVSLDKPEEYIMNITNGYGADVVIECSGSHHALNLALDLVRKKGKIVQLGIYHGETKIRDLSKLIFKEVEFIGSISHIYENWLQSINLISKKKVIVKPLISHTFKLSEFMEAFNMSASTKSLKVIIQPEV